MNFYLLENKPRKDGKVPLSTTREYLGCIVINCAACSTRGVLHNSMHRKVDIEVKVRDIAGLEDIESAGTNTLVSAKFRDAVKEANLTGLEFYPILGYKTKGRKQGYQEMIRLCREEFQFKAVYVTGKGGSIAQTSGVQLVKSCDVCGWREWTLPEHGIVIDESQWDGSDFFLLEDMGGVYMTERAAKVLDQADLSNFFAQLTTDYRPGKLPNYTIKKY